MDVVGKTPVVVPPRFITLQIGIMEKMDDRQKTDIVRPGDRPTKITGGGRLRAGAKAPADPAPSPEGPPEPSTKGAPLKGRFRMRTIKKHCFEHPTWRVLHPDAPTNERVLVSARTSTVMPKP